MLQEIFCLRLKRREKILISLLLFFSFIGFFVVAIYHLLCKDWLAVSQY